MTFDRRLPLMEDDFLYKTTFDGRRLMMKDNLWRKTILSFLNWSLTLKTKSCLIVLILVTASPNIVIIVADDLGYNDVSWHNPVVRTPHLESLARDGVLLEQHYSQPSCSPTRAALLSGR